VYFLGCSLRNITGDSDGDSDGDNNAPMKDAQNGLALLGQIARAVRPRRESRVPWEVSIGGRHWRNVRRSQSMTTCVIIDLEFPRLGLIRIDAADRVLFDLRESMP
jgi:hypothetical protein